MLNRHAIVLLLGNAAILLLRPYPSSAVGMLAVGFLALLVGLLLDPGRGGLSGAASWLLQATGLGILIFLLATSVASGAPEIHFLFALAGILLAVAGTLLELLLDYDLLRIGVAIQALGDALYLVALALALLTRAQRPSALGWTFIAIAGGLSAYAALYNLLLQIRRLRDRQAGWTYRVVAQHSDGLRVRSPSGEQLIPWQDIQAVQRIDRRRLVLVLPSPLPPGLSRRDLPWEELRANPEPLPDEKTPPDRYGLVLHEQELGCAIADAEQSLRQKLQARDTS